MDAYINGAIKAVVSRCTAASLREVLKKWRRLSTDELNTLKGTKVQLCADLQDIAKRDHCTREIAGDLELAYMQLNSDKKLWKVFNLKGNNIDLSLTHNPRWLRSKLVRSVQIKAAPGNVESNMSLFAGALWLRLHLQAQTRPKKGVRAETPEYNHSSSIFLLTYPGSSKFILSRSSVKNSRIVLEAMKEATGAERIVDSHLSGQHIASLADLALRTQQQPDDKYRKLEEKENPLAKKLFPKRKASEPLTEFEGLNLIEDETRPVKRQRRESIAKVFGIGPQPKLEKLEYKFEATDPAAGFTCKATFEVKGKAVLDGFCSLATDGFIKFPLRKHHTSVINLAQNSLSVRDKT